MGQDVIELVKDKDVIWLVGIDEDVIWLVSIDKDVV